MVYSCPSPILAQLADFLHARNERLTKRWLAYVHEDGRLSMAEQLPVQQVIALVPQLIDDLAQLLRSESNATDSICFHAAQYGQDRVKHGYQLHDLLRELAWLRRVIIEELINYGLGHPESIEPLRQLALNQIPDCFDEIVLHSSAPFVEDSQLDQPRFNEKFPPPILNPNQSAQARIQRPR